MSKRMKKYLITLDDGWLPEGAKKKSVFEVSCKKIIITSLWLICSVRCPQILAFLALSPRLGLHSLLFILSMKKIFDILLNRLSTVDIQAKDKPPFSVRLSYNTSGDR